MSISILLIEDEFLIAKDIQMVLQKEDYAIVQRASTPEEASAIFAKDTTIDLILSDINLNADKDGIDTVAELIEARRVPVVYLTAYSSPDLVARAEKTMPFAYVLKPYNEQQLKITINIALSKFEGIREKVTIDEDNVAKVSLLTNREKEILIAFSSGRTSKEVGEQLHISYQTVEKHKKNIKSKLGLNTIGELVKFTITSHLSE